MTAKMLIILLISVMYAMFFLNTVKATSIEQIDFDIDRILEAEEKIMKYDARTNEITEVNMEELEQVLKMKKILIVKYHIVLCHIFQMKYIQTMQKLIFFQLMEKE